jgi:hypothetical protein
MSLGVRAPRLQHADGESTWVVLTNTVERGCDARIGLGTLCSCQTDRLHSTTPRSCKLPLIRCRAEPGLKRARRGNHRKPWGGMCEATERGCSWRTIEFGLLPQPWEGWRSQPSTRTRVPK